MTDKVDCPENWEWCSYYIQTWGPVFVFATKMIAQWPTNGKQLCGWRKKKDIARLREAINRVIDELARDWQEDQEDCEEPL